MGATERKAKARGQVLPDSIAAQPSGGTRALRGTLVGLVRLRADNDNPLRVDDFGRIATEPGEVAGVEDDEIRFPICDCRGDTRLVRDGLDLPTGCVLLEQIDDQLP